MIYIFEVSSNVTYFIVNQEIEKQDTLNKEEDVVDSSFKKHKNSCQNNYYDALIMSGENKSPKKSKSFKGNYLQRSSSQPKVVLIDIWDEGSHDFTPKSTRHQDNLKFLAKPIKYSADPDFDGAIDSPNCELFFRKFEFLLKSYLKDYIRQN